ncbi:MAG TPA: substrate-binding domain-containing protein, partial [Allocoleopsis sp.]
MMLHSKSSSIFALALLVTLFSAPKPTEAAFTDSLLAQSPVSPSPALDGLPAGTLVRIDGSNSMMQVNQALKQQWQEQYPDSTVEDRYDGTPAALQALQAGNIDVAALGRPLTEAEKAAGLTEVPVGRQKIAIVVGANNSFNGDLTFEQFAQLFRGEITDWSELGGAAGAIRFIDHPVESDTRQSFSRYPVFQAAPFENGATTVRLTQDSADAVAAALGTNGIGYIIANQAINLPGVRILSMHGTLPTDPR